MENEVENESENRSKMTRNKISILLIGFYAGMCVISDLAVKYYFKDKRSYTYQQWKALREWPELFESQKLFTYNSKIYLVQYLFDKHI